MPPVRSARRLEYEAQKAADQRARPHLHEMDTRTAPRQARSAKSLDLILDAAERLMQQRGVVETSTVDVAACAGVSVGRLYYWFPDKDAVVRAVLTRSEHRLRSFLTAMVVDEADLVGQLLPAVCQFFREHQGSLAVLQRGKVDGHDPGAPLCHLFVELIGQALRVRDPDLPAEERDLVANTVVRIVITMLAEYVRADDQQAGRHLAELECLVSAYLQRRVPAHATTE
jgi:AcrR family transcriptional regulator